MHEASAHFGWMGSFALGVSSALAQQDPGRKLHYRPRLADFGQGDIVQKLQDATSVGL